jgi:hypothetical protein
MSTGHLKNDDHSPSSDIIMTVKVLGAKYLKGSKGDHINSLVRVQFADFDFKDVGMRIKK